MITNNYLIVPPKSPSAIVFLRVLPPIMCGPPRLSHILCPSLPLPQRICFIDGAFLGFVIIFAKSLIAALMIDDFA